MNQFGQLQQFSMPECRMSILLDCCTIIGAKNNNARVIQFRRKIAGRKDIRLVIPDIVVREVAKVGNISKEEATKLAESFSKEGRIDYVKSSAEVEREAEFLKSRYPDSCHYPDNHYLVHCRDNNAILVTYDRKLKEVARLEGIMTCSPDNFRIYG